MATATTTNVRHLRPPTVAFKPSMWGDVFSTFSFDDQLQEKYTKQMEVLKKEVRSMLMAATSTKLMILVDHLERLGLAYHFETEIEVKLKQVYDEKEDYDLFTTALRFRLLRQHHFHVSCNDFNKFIDNDDGKWQETLIHSVEGMLALYEAAHVRIHDENILDEAVAFTVHRLTRMLPELEPLLKEKVEHALKQSNHRGIPLLSFRFYITLYGTQGSIDQTLLKLAKINFNSLQNIYRKELAELTRWWDKFDLKTKLPYARDRIVESYAWGNAMRYEPQYAGLRVAFAKNVQFCATMDDTYDNYATLEENDIFTEALDRWNLGEIDTLPDFMKILYKHIMFLSEEYEREAEKQGKPFATHYYKESVKQLSRAYKKEQKWIVERKMPSFEEYVANSIITSCINVLFTGVVPSVKSITEEAVQWLLSQPKVLKSTAMMIRTLDDLGSHERENRDGKLPTAVDCYMKDKGVSKQEAFSEFSRLVENGWKDVTAEWVKGSAASKELVELLINYGRKSDVTYKKNKDGFTDPEKHLGPQIAALYLEPIPI